MKKKRQGQIEPHINMMQIKLPNGIFSSESFTAASSPNQIRHLKILKSICTKCPYYQLREINYSLQPTMDLDN